MTANAEEQSKISAELSRYAGGTTQWYSTPGYMFTYTDGILALVNLCRCKWLLDAIASYQGSIRKNHPQSEAWQFWELLVDENNKAVLSCYPDDGEPAIARQEIEYTDFPLSKIRVWLASGTLILPSEY